MNRGCQADPGRVHNTVVGEQRGWGHRRHARGARRNDAKAIGAPIAYGQKIAGARQQLLQKQGTLRIGSGAHHEAEILGSHKRSGAILSILSACDSARSQTKAPMSFAPTAAASLRSTKTDIGAR